MINLGGIKSKNQMILPHLLSQKRQKLYLGVLVHYIYRIRNDVNLEIYQNLNIGAEWWILVMGLADLCENTGHRPALPKGSEPTWHLCLLPSSVKYKITKFSNH